MHAFTDDFHPPAQVDEYKVIRPIGRGAMGQVYLGHDTNLDRPVAIKFVAALRPGGSVRERFIVEARAIARLHHPNVVAVYRVGAADGLPYLVYEFVEGRSLSELQKPLPWRRVLKIAIELTSGLAEAHRRGVLHRDIKPANVLLSTADEVKLLDFGLAKLLQESGIHQTPWLQLMPRLRMPRPPSSDQADTISFEETEPQQLLQSVPGQTDRQLPLGPQEITDTGARLGTPLYMAPEIWQGEAGTERSDLYSLGALLYELCSGHPPHVAQTTVDLAALVTGKDAVLLEERAGELPPALAKAINACLRRAPDERPRSAMALTQLLEGVGAHGEAVAIPEGNPYRGLRPFEAADRSLLFGRDQDIRAVVEQLRTDPLVLLTGDSGVGKSSLCRAGVVPQIREGALKDGRRWSVASLSPGRWLLDTLADALAPHLRMCHSELVESLRKEPGMVAVALSQRLGESYGLLLFIDQMEELVTQSDRADAVRMGELLSHLCQRLPGVRVLAAVRGDFLTRLAERTRLSYELARALYLLRTLLAPELREVIVGPARMKGVAFESEEMVQSIVTSTLDAQGGLPLLQFTLAQLWETRDVKRGIICTESLEHLGGVAGSLARYADGVYEHLLPEQRAAAEHLLTRLVRIDGTRTSRKEEELLSNDPAMRATLDALVRARLVVARRLGVDTNAYELSHEALLTGWKRLRDWLSNAQERRAAMERAEAAAAEWSRLGQPRDMLWRSLQLLDVEKHGVASQTSSPRVAAFLSDSRRYALRQRRWRVASVASGAVLALVCAVLLVSHQQGKEYKLHNDSTNILGKVHQAGKENSALSDAINLMQSQASERSSILQRRFPIPAVVDLTLHEVLMAPGPAVPVLLHDDTVQWVEYSPDGQRVVSASDDGTARLWSTTDGSQKYKLSDHRGPVLMARFSQDGKAVVTASQDSTARIWDGNNGLLRATLRGHSKPVLGAAFSPDGRYVATVSEDRQACLWDAKTGVLLTRLIGHLGSVRAFAFSPDGSRLVTASEDRTARVWTVPGGVQKFALADHGDVVSVVNYSPNGQRIVTGSDDKVGRVWDADTGELLAKLIDHKSPLIAAEFSMDGSRILTAASEDVAARLWNAEKGVRLATLSGHTRELSWATFSRDSSRIATMGADHLVRLWHGETGAQLGAYRGHHSEVLHAAFAPDGRHLVTAGRDHTAQIWVEQLGDVSVLPLHQGPVWTGSMSPNGELIATGSGDGKVRLWSAKSKQLIIELVGHGRAVLSAAFSPDSNWLVTSSFNSKNNVRLWDVSNRRLARELAGHTERVERLAFSPNGLRLLTVSHDKTARIWSMPDGQLLHTLTGHKQAVYQGGFSPDGKSVITASVDSTARVWNVESGACIYKLLGHNGPLWFAGFSPNGEQIITASEDRTARLWSAATGNLIKELNAHTDWVVWAAFSRDNKTVVTVSVDGTGLAWDTATGAQRYELRGHREGIWEIQFSQDGERIVTASTDHTARLWNAHTGEPLGVFRGHTGPVIFANFLPDSQDGTKVLTGSTDQTARIYYADRKSWIQQACKHLGRWPEFNKDLPNTCKSK